MALIDKKMVDDVMNQVTERVDSGTKEATKIKKFELGFEIMKELKNIGGVTPEEETEFLKKMLKSLGFNME